MLKLKEIKIGTDKCEQINTLMKELSYKGNVGIVEMMQFLNKATDEEKKQMDVAVANQDVKTVLALISKVVGVDLIVSDTPESK